MAKRAGCQPKPNTGKARIITAEGGNVWMNALNRNTSCWKSRPPFRVTAIPRETPKTSANVVADTVKSKCAPVISQIVLRL